MPLQQLPWVLGTKGCPWKGAQPGCLKGAPYRRPKFRAQGNLKGESWVKCRVQGWQCVQGGGQRRQPKGVFWW